MAEEKKQLAVTNPGAAYLGLDFQQIKNVATALAASGIFPDARSGALAFAKILAGQEMGLTPFQAMQEMSFINGRPNVSAHAKAASIKRTGRYDYQIVELDNKHCILEFFRDGKSQGKVEYNEAMAKASGVYDRNPQYKKVPDDMYFAGAIRKGQRRYAPDSLGGINSYDSDERIIMETGEIVEEPEMTVSAERVASELTPKDLMSETDYVGEKGPLMTPEGHINPNVDVDALEQMVEEAFTPNPITPKQKAKIFAVLNSKGIKGEDQKLVLYGLAQARVGEGTKIESTNDISKELAMELIDYMEGASGEELRGGGIPF